MFYTHTYTHIPHIFFYPFLCWWTLSCFIVLPIVNSTSVNIGVHVSFRISVFIFFRYPEVELLDNMVWFSSVHSLSRVRLFATPWTAAHQATLSITNSWSLLKLLSIESVMPSNYLILCRPLLLPPSVFPSIRVFSNGSVLHIKWPKYWSFSFSISPSNEY